MKGAAAAVRALRTRSQTIRVRLTLWYVVVLLLILGTFSGYLYVRLGQTLQQQADRTLTLDAQHVTSNLNVQSGTVTLGDAVSNLPPGVILMLYDTSGRQIASSEPNFNSPTIQEAIQLGRNNQTTFLTTRVSGSSWRVLTQPVFDDNKQAVGVLQVAESQHQTNAALNELRILMAVAVPLTLLVAVVGGMFFTSRALDPIDRITRAAKRIEAGDLSQRLNMPASADEVGRLAATFDEMLERLERAFSQQRQFTAAASHELRTPLALLMSHTEVVLQRPRTVGEYRATLEEIQAEVQTMRLLVSELLMLARADSGKETLAQEPVALASLVEDVVPSLDPLAEEHGITLTLGELAPCTVEGDQTRLTQMLINLVDNAVKYTPAGGNVHVTVKATKEQAVITVTDTGVGISAEHLPHLFERFYRAEASRSRDAGGTGLGLSIVQWIVQAHHGSIEATSTLGKGSTFTVTLPLAAVPTLPPQAMPTPLPAAAR